MSQEYKHVTASKGDIGVAYVMADLIKKGADVLTPMSQVSPYDLGIFFLDSFYRVQVKYRSVDSSGAITVKVRRLRSSPRLRSKRYSYGTNDEFDVLAIYCPEISSVAYIMRDDMNEKGCITLRIHPPKNNQKANINVFLEKTELPEKIKRGL